MHEKTLLKSTEDGGAAMGAAFCGWVDRMVFRMDDCRCSRVYSALHVSKGLRRMRTHPQTEMCRHGSRIQSLGLEKQMVQSTPSSSKP